MQRPRGAPISINHETPEAIVSRNNGGDAAVVSTTFAEVLHEHDEWDVTLYWSLDKALCELAVKYKSEAMPKKLIRDIMQVYNYVHGRLCWHRMHSDASSIKGFSDDDCFAWAERVSFVFTAALCGQDVPNDKFEHVNPLL